MPALDTTLLANGVIYTMDGRAPTASHLLIGDGKILAVGGSEVRERAGTDVPVTDLEGRCVVPGLVDSHIHFATFALGMGEVDLSGMCSLDQVLSRVAERAREVEPDEWIKGRGWDQEQWPEARFPAAADLDRVTQRHPVALTAKSGHAMVVNSLALKRVGITAETQSPEGGRIERDASGQPTGLLFEEAMKLIQRAIPYPGAEEVTEALQDGFSRAWRVGLTAVHDMAIQETQDPIVFDAYQRLRARGQLGLRVVKYLPVEAMDYVLALSLRSGLGDEWLRVGGIKLFADGALGSRTAAMLEPYNGEPDNLGILIREPEALEELMGRAIEGGLALAVHAIGDRANRVVLDGLAETVSPASGLRHRIEHVQLIHPRDLDRLAQLGVVASMQPIHAVQDAPMVDRYWGGRCATAYAWRSLQRTGAVLAFGSDCPVEDLNPFLGVHAAVTRVCPEGYAGPQGWHPEECLSVEEAVRAYTWGAAYAVGMEDQLGTLSPGKWADLVVLDRDIFTCDPAAIAETEVMGTMINGEWVYQR